MIIPGKSVACFAALSASSFSLIPMCAGTLHIVICFPWLWSLLVCHISGLILDGFLCCSVYITYLMFILFCISSKSLVIVFLSSEDEQCLLQVLLFYVVFSSLSLNGLSYICIVIYKGV